MISKEFQPTNTRYMSTTSCEERLERRYSCTKQTTVGAPHSLGFREESTCYFFSDVENAWELDSCGNSGPLSESAVVLAEIATIKKAHGSGAIHGVVRGSEGLPEAMISGAHIEAVGKNGRYPATTNENGKFEIKVPAGQYVVTASKSGITFGKAQFSYEDPQKVRIEPGGCAQVEFAEMDGSPGR